MYNFCGNAALRVLFVGVTWFAVVYAGLYVLDSQTIRHPAKEDRISQLPDHIISSIISRLSTRDAVRTSLLSRRWRHIYTYINQVRFCCADLNHDYTWWNPFREGADWRHLRRKFVERVNTFLHHHSGSKIVSFELDCCFRKQILGSFKEWMNSIGELGVEQLTIGFCSLYYLHQNAFTVFSTDFLTEGSCFKHLCLRGGSFLTPNKNALGVLELDHVYFNSEAVQSMLTNCSCLQLLNLRFCVLPTKLLIHGPHLELKSLMIYQCINLKEIDLSANNLINCEIYNPSILKLSFYRVPLLQTLSIQFDDTEAAPYVFGKVAQDLPHLESMVFTTRASFFEACKLDRVISKLSNLRHLVLILEEGNNKLDPLELDVFLDSCPLLHKFQLSMVITWTFDQKRAQERSVKRDTRLKEVEFNGFRGTECQYNFILYILKSVVSLERLVLSERILGYNMYLRRWMADPITTNLGNVERKHQIICERLHGQSISENVEIIVS